MGQLYEDTVAIDVDESVVDKVVFTSFVGIAPRRFQEFFESVKGSRKNQQGNAVKWSPARAEIIVDGLVHSYVKLETDVVGYLGDLLERKGYEFVAPEKSKS